MIHEWQKRDNREDAAERVGKSLPMFRTIIAVRRKGRINHKGTKNTKGMKA